MGFHQEKRSPGNRKESSGIFLRETSNRDGHWRIFSRDWTTFFTEEPVCEKYLLPVKRKKTENSSIKDEESVVAVSHIETT